MTLEWDLPVRLRLRSLAIVMVLCAAACGSKASPVGDAVDQAATYHGLSVRLDVDPPTVEDGWARMVGYFLIENRTTRVISYGGCPFGQFRSGLVPVDHPDAPLSGSSQTSCGAGTTSVQPGASTRYFATNFSNHVPAGEYLAVVRFPDGTEVRKSTTIAPSRLRIAPTSARPLQVVSVRGERCGKSSGSGTLDVIVNLTTPDRRTGLVATHAPIAPDGTWRASLTIPVTSAPGDYQVNARCNRGGDVIEVEYESEPFTVTT